VSFIPFDMGLIEQRDQRAHITLRLGRNGSATAGARCAPCSSSREPPHPRTEPPIGSRRSAQKGRTERRFDERIRVVEDWGQLARFTRDGDPLLFPAISGIYTTSASARFMDTGLLEQESHRVREKINAMRMDSDARMTP
jgi:hypothetical protein